MKERTYIAIDLKSFYASVECLERNLDPMTTNLVVADKSRTEKTICLAVSPSLKSYGIPGRPRLFEVIQKVKEINAQRQRKAPNRKLTDASSDDTVVKATPSMALDYIVAPPQMAKYMEWSARIYQTYLKYVAPEDIHVYSIDEVMMDVTDYLPARGQTAREFAMTMILDVLATTGVTATAGIGPNLYLCKVAMDIMAKHISPDPNGVRVAELDEMAYRIFLWNHQPLTDFWRVGNGYAKRLMEHGLCTMGDIARCSLEDEDLLYKLFGVNAELLIDHAWGWEPTTIADIKAYKPQSNSIGSGQVLHCPYPYDQTRLVVWEMADQLSLDLVDKGLVTNQLVLTVGYDMENLKDPQKRKAYHGEVTADRYGRPAPKHAHGTQNLDRYTSSTKLITQATMNLFDRIVDPGLLARRVNLVAARVVPESSLEQEEIVEQLDLFTDQVAEDRRREEEAAELERERKRQEAVLSIKKRYGKNAILKGANLVDGATAKDRNGQIGGHKA
ncbi:MAG: DNA methylase [Oscillospiraceae bacterium]|jgi:DNA polymerase V|nr:DNA methylase [Oscillospiraceae bacterium]